MKGKPPMPNKGVSLPLKTLWVTERVNVSTGVLFWDFESIGHTIEQVKRSAQMIDNRYYLGAENWKVVRYVEFSLTLTGREELVEPKEQKADG